MNTVGEFLKRDRRVQAAGYVISLIVTFILFLFAISTEGPLLFLGALLHLANWGVVAYGIIQEESLWLTRKESAETTTFCGRIRVSDCLRRSIRFVLRKPHYYISAALIPILFEAVWEDAYLSGLGGYCFRYPLFRVNPCQSSDMERHEHRPTFIPARVETILAIIGVLARTTRTPGNRFLFRFHVP